MRRRYRILSILLIFISVTSLLAGCGAGSRYDKPAQGALSGPSYSDSVYDGNYDLDNDYTIDGGVSKDESWIDDSSNNSKPDDAKIIWTGEVILETMDWDTTDADFEALIAEYGARISKMHTSGDKRDGQDYRLAVYTLRVPSESFVKFMGAMEGIMGSVLSSYMNSYDATRTYNENELTLQVYQDEYAALQKLLEQAETLSDVFTIRDRMNEVARQIKILSDSNTNITYNSELSEVSVTIREVIVYTEPEEPEVGFFSRLGTAFGTGFKKFITGCGNVLVWIAGNFLQLLFYCGIIGVVVWICVRASRKADKQQNSVNKQTSVSVYNKPSNDVKNNNGGNSDQ